MHSMALRRPQGRKVSFGCELWPRFFRFLTRRSNDVGRNRTTTQSRSQLYKPYCSDGGGVSRPGETQPPPYRSCQGRHEGPGE